MNAFEILEKSLLLPSPLIPFCPSWDGAESVSIWVKRDDMIHPVISGNKWRKLAYALRDNQAAEVISFGGGFSNHIHALGYVCYKLKIKFTAIIRGDYSAAPTPMICDLMRWNTQIEYVNRITYQKRNDEQYLSALQTKHPLATIIPEGGSQQAALMGVQELVHEITIPFDAIMAPVASGATLAGITSALGENQTAIGIGVLKGQGYLESLVSQFLPHPINNWVINHNYHCGGYAKVPATLATFCEEFNQTMPFKIEPVYSGKVFWALKNMLSVGFFEPGTKIVIVHTGGLQGARDS